MLVGDWFGEGGRGVGWGISNFRTLEETGFLGRIAIV